MFMVELTKGWKGYLGATLVILAGIYLLATGNTTEGISTIGIGLGLLGIRHNLDYREE